MYKCTYIYKCGGNGLDYEWDPRKAAQNSKKHAVHFADAVTALEDEHALTFRDPASLAEEPVDYAGERCHVGSAGCGLRLAR